MSEIDDRIAKLSWEIDGLTEQLKQLEAEKETVERVRLEAKMVKVVCPSCDGYGSGYGNNGPSDCDDDCDRCVGKGYLLAVPFAEKTRPSDAVEIQALLGLSEIDR